MEMIYIAIVVVLLTLFYNIFILPIQRNKKITDKLSVFEKQGFILMKEEKKPYDYTLDSENLTIYIKFVYVPKHSIITINNRSTWRLSWGGNPNKPGRPFPNHRYISEIDDFSKFTIKKEKKTLKLFLIYEKTEKILMYLNESELDFVTTKTSPYGYKVSNFSSIEEDFNDLITYK